MQRYFGEKKIGNEFILNDDDLYHIRRVMRMHSGDEIQVVYNQIPYLCQLNFNKDDIKIIIKEKLKTNTQKKEVTLFIPLLKEQKMDLILQKSTELGVSKIIPIITTRSVIKLDKEKISKKKERWQKICKEASEQSFRDDIPIVDDVKSLLEMEKHDGIMILCSTKEKVKNIKNILQTNRECDKITVVMGPEGGFTEDEELYLNSIGFQSVTLGNNIMRIETVPIFIMSVINYENMEA